MKWLKSDNHRGWLILLSCLTILILTLVGILLRISYAIDEVDSKVYPVLTQQKLTKIRHTKRSTNTSDLMAEKNRKSNYGKIVISTGEYPPFVYMQDGKMMGISYEVIQLVFSKMTVDTNIIIEPWNRGLYEMNRGNRFGVFPYAITPERQQHYLFSEQLYDSDINDNFFFGYSLDESEARQINGWKDINGMKIGGVYGYYYLNVFQERNIQIDISANEKECLQKLIDGKIDLAVFNPLVVKHLVGTHFPEAENKFIQTAFQLNPTYIGDYFMINADDYSNELFLNKFNQTLSELKANGEIQKILDKYLDGVRLN